MRPSFKIMKKIASVLFCVLFFTSSQALSDEPQRGLFVSVIQSPPTLTSREAIAELIDFSKKAGIQTLFVQIYRANKAWFKSEVGDSSPYIAALQSVGEDPLALLIQSAHAQGIEVHAWLNLLSLSDNQNAPLLKKHGLEILTRNMEEKKSVADYLIDNQYWLEPGDLRVRQELSKMVAEVVKTYPDLDGIQLDYIRYPDTKPAYGYTLPNLKRFVSVTGSEKINEKTEEWRKWKRDQVTELVKLLRSRALGMNPKLHFSTTGCMSYVRAREEAFQDWALWLNEGVVEFVTMMSYPPDVATFEKYLTEAKNKVDDFTKVNVGLGAYKLAKNPNIFSEQWKICEKSGGRSCVAFHYGDLVETPALAEPLRLNGPQA